MQATVSGSGEFQIQLSSLVNEDWVLNDGSCCNTIPGNTEEMPTCSTPCQTFFRICLSNYQAKLNPLQAQCRFGELTTGILKETVQRGIVGNVRRMTSQVASSGQQQQQQLVDTAASIKFDFTWPVRL